MYFDKDYHKLLSNCYHSRTIDFFFFGDPLLECERHDYPNHGGTLNALQTHTYY